MEKDRQGDGGRERGSGKRERGEGGRDGKRERGYMLDNFSVLVIVKFTSR